MLVKQKAWKNIFNTDSKLSEDLTQKQIMIFKTTVNRINLWRYLIICCFDWNTGVFQQTVVVRVYYILKDGLKNNQEKILYFFRGRQFSYLQAMICYLNIKRLTVQSIAEKKKLKKLLRETTIFSWNAVLGNILFTKIAENGNIYFFIKITHFL